MKKSIIANASLAPEGRKKLNWAAAHMPVVGIIGKEFIKDKPFKGLTVGASLHVTKETGILLQTLKAGGAKVVVCGCNPLSTQDDVAAALATEGIEVFAWRGQTSKEYYQCIADVLSFEPDITIDDGCDLISYIHTKKKNLLGKIRGGCEETTMGVNRLRAMEKDGALKYPVVAVNDAYTKHLFDNRYGTGQSSLDGILRATSILFAGKTVVVVGYGWCGRGVAVRAKGLGAQVVVCEVDPIKGLEAVMDGYMVMSINDAAKVGDIFITVTSGKHVINWDHIKQMKEGAILANAGHADKEIDVQSITKNAKKSVEIRPNTVQFTFANGRSVYVLGEGRIINLVAAEGHPSEVMDMSFATQALAARYIADNYQKLSPGVHTTPLEQDRRIAALKLKSMGIGIDTLTAAQKKYLSSWEEGT